MERWPFLGEAVGRFLVDTRASSTSARTHQTYSEQLWQFRDTPLPVRGRKRAFNPPKLDREYLSYLTDQTCRELVGLRMDQQARNTARTFAGALAAFCTWAEEVYGYPSPMAKVPIPKAPKTPHRYLSKSQVQALYQACPDDEHRAMILLLLEGVRSAELLTIRWTDIEEESILVHGKGDKWRRIPIEPQLRAILGGLARRDTRICPFTYPILNKRLRRLGLAAIGLPVKPHDLRRTWATHSLMEGLDVLSVQTIGGWSNDRQIRERYATPVIEEQALRKARNLGLTGRLLSGPSDSDARGTSTP